MGYEVLEQPVLQWQVEIADWNVQHGIVEITYETFKAIVESGGRRVESPVSTSATDAATDLVVDSWHGREVDELPDLDLAGRADPLPALQPLEVQPSDEVVPSLDGDDDRDLAPPPPRGRAQQRLDKLAEQRAIHLVRRYLAEQRWLETADMQKQGVGYDLKFERDGQELHVEVKGVQGSRLHFNLTAKEWQRVLHDENFVVLSVTNVLDDARLRVRVVTRQELASSARAPLGYRVKVSAT